MFHNRAGTHEVDASGRLHSVAADRQTLESGRGYRHQKRIAGEIEVNAASHGCWLHASAGERIEDGHVPMSAAEEQRDVRGLIR